MSVPYNFETKTMKETEPKDIPIGSSFVIMFWEQVTHHSDFMGFQDQVTYSNETQLFVTQDKKEWVEAIQMLKSTNTQNFITFVSNRPNIKAKYDIEVVID